MLSEVIDCFERQRVLPVLRGRDPGRLAAVCDKVIDAGLTVVELTCTTDDPVNDLASAYRRRPDAVVDMGTVTRPEQVTPLADAGAAFIVTPFVAIDVIPECTRKDVPVIVGALSVH